MSTQDRAGFQALVKAFGEGWEGGDADRIAGVFAEDGVFVADPFAAPIRGREAIREYWKDVPLEQSEVAFRYGEIFSVGPWFAAEFKCTFRRRRTGEPVDVRGAIFCETESEKVTEMRIYYHRMVDAR